VKLETKTIPFFLIEPVVPDEAAIFGGYWQEFGK